jgi:hypothetical protein
MDVNRRDIIDMRNDHLQYSNISKAMIPTPSVHRPHSTESIYVASDQAVLVEPPPKAAGFVPHSTPKTE